MFYVLCFKFNSESAISLSGLTSRFTDENIESFLEALISTSKKACLAFGSK